MLGGLGCGGVLRCPKTGTGGRILCLHPRSRVPCKLRVWYSSRLPLLLHGLSPLLLEGVLSLRDKHQPLPLSRTLLFATSVESELPEARKRAGVDPWLDLGVSTAVV